MQAGDVVKTTGFWPSKKTVGELGGLVRRWEGMTYCWEVYFHGTGRIHIIALAGLELVDENR